MGPAAGSAGRRRWGSAMARADAGWAAAPLWGEVASLPRPGLGSVFVRVSGTHASFHAHQCGHLLLIFIWLSRWVEFAGLTEYKRSRFVSKQTLVLV